MLIDAYNPGDIAAIVLSISAIVGALVTGIGFLTKSSRDVARDRLEEIKELRQQNARARDRLDDAADNLKQAEAECTGRVHALELVLAERENRIATLEARPSTESIAEAMQQMDATFTKHRADLVGVLDRVADSQQQIADSQSQIADSQLRVEAALEAMATRYQERRHDDPDETETT